MDHYTRRIVGVGIHAGTVDGRALCRMFNHAIRGLSRPTRLSSDHDPLYRFHLDNLRVESVPPSGNGEHKLSGISAMLSVAIQVCLQHPEMLVTCDASVVLLRLHEGHGRPAPPSLRSSSW